MQVIDATLTLEKYFHNAFDIAIYERYINEVIPNSFDMIYQDIANYDFKNDCLPIIDRALREKALQQEIRQHFHVIVKDLNHKIAAIFHKELNCTIILYLGLCNGAGWVTSFNDTDYVLLGIEKIIELGWNRKKDMIGLLYHELGHVYQKQFGILEQDFDSKSDEMIWQLFTEGIAMVFEQKIVDDRYFYHQDKNGWLSFAEKNITQIKKDFARDAQSANNRYFGDWCDYRGYGDIGYYLGTQLIYYILKYLKFDDIINFSIAEVNKYWKEYLKDTSLEWCVFFDWIVRLDISPCSLKPLSACNVFGHQILS